MAKDKKTKLKCKKVKSKCSPTRQRQEEKCLPDVFPTSVEPSCSSHEVGQDTSKWKHLFRYKTPIEHDRCFFEKRLTLLDILCLNFGIFLSHYFYEMPTFLTGLVGPGILIAILFSALFNFLYVMIYSIYIQKYECGGACRMCGNFSHYLGFILCWNMMFLFILFGALLATSCSNLIDLALDGKMKLYSHQHFNYSVPCLAPFPDFVAFHLVLMATFVVTLRLKPLFCAIYLFTGINIIIILALIIMLSIRADLKNFEIAAGPETGEGGLFPYGVDKLFVGFFLAPLTYTGYNIAVIADPEALEFRKDVPKSILLSYIPISIFHILIGCLHPASWPYYRNKELTYYYTKILGNIPRIFTNSPYLYVFVIGALAANIAGASFGGSWMLTLFYDFYRILCCIYAVSRIIYGMACRKMICKAMTTLVPFTTAPFTCVFLAGCVTGLMALLLDPDRLFRTLPILFQFSNLLIASCLLFSSVDFNWYPEQQEKCPKPIAKIAIKLCSGPSFSTANQQFYTLDSWVIPIFWISLLLFAVLLAIGYWLSLPRIPVVIMVIFPLILFVFILTIMEFLPKKSMPKFLKRRVCIIFYAIAILLSTAAMVLHDYYAWGLLLIVFLTGQAVYFINSSQKERPQEDWSWKSEVGSSCKSSRATFFSEESRLILYQLDGGALKGMCQTYDGEKMEAEDGKIDLLNCLNSEREQIRSPVSPEILKGTTIDDIDCQEVLILKSPTDLCKPKKVEVIGKEELEKVNVKNEECQFNSKFNEPCLVSKEKKQIAMTGKSLKECAIEPDKKMKPATSQEARNWCEVPKVKSEIVLKEFTPVRDVADQTPVETEFAERKDDMCNGILDSVQKESISTLKKNETVPLTPSWKPVLIQKVDLTSCVMRNVGGKESLTMRIKYRDWKPESQSEGTSEEPEVQLLKNEEAKPLNIKEAKPLNIEEAKPLNIEEAKPLNIEEAKPLNNTECLRKEAHSGENLKSKEKVNVKLQLKKTGGTKSSEAQDDNRGLERSNPKDETAGTCLLPKVLNSQTHDGTPQIKFVVSRNTGVSVSKSGQNFKDKALDPKGGEAICSQGKNDTEQHPSSQAICKVCSKQFSGEITKTASSAQYDKQDFSSSTIKETKSILKKRPEQPNGK